MNPLIAGNWKMHKTPSEAVAWIGDLATALAATPHGHADLLLNVPATHLAPMHAALVDAGLADTVALGGQDLSQHDEGAYTGEVSGAMLRDAGASWVVVGHSERRAYHHEDDALIGRKVAAARSHGLTPILCVGERLEEREAGRAETVVLGQLSGALVDIEADDADELVIAYEPVWAIGTGKTATADDAQAMCASIRAALSERYGDVGAEIRVLYGGSMKPGNAAELVGKADVDGGLIGGASLEVEALLGIVSRIAP